MSGAPGSDGVAAPRRPWRRRLRSWFVRGVGFAVLLGAGALVVFEERIEDRLRQTIEHRVARATGGTLEIGALDLEWTRLGATVEGVRLVVPSRGAGDPLTVEVARARAALALRGLPGLAAGRVHLSGFEAGGARVTLDQGYVDALPRGRPRRDRAFDVRVDRIDVSDASFVYADRELPLDLRTRDTRIRGVWSAYRRALAGEVTTGAELAARAFREPLPVTVSGSFRLTEQRVEVYEARATAPGVVADLDEQTVSWDGPTIVTADARVRADLGELAPWLDLDLPGLSGTVEGDVAWSVGGGGPVQVRGRVDARDFVLGPLRLAEADLGVTVDPGVASIEVRSARGLGGDLVGQVDLRYGEATTIRIDARGREVAIAAILAALDLPVPLAATGDVEVRFEGAPDDVRSWSSEGSFRMRAAAAAGDRLPTTSDGRFSIASGRLSLRAPDARIGATRLDLEVEQDLVGGTGEVRFEGATSDAADTQHRALRLLREFDVELPEALQAPVRGSGRIAGAVGIGGDVELDLEVDLADGAYGEEAFERLAIEVGLVGERIRVRRFEVSNDDWFARGSLELETAGPTLVAGEGEAVDLPLAVLVRLGAPELPTIGGRLGGAVVVRSGPAGLEGSGRIRVRDVEWEGERIDEATAAFVASGDRAVFTDLAAYGPAIRLAGGLDVEVGERRATLTIGTAAVELGRLAVAGTLGEDLEARLDASGVLVLTPESVLGDLDIRGENWTFGAREVPPLGGALRFEEDGAAVRLSSIDTDAWTIEGAVRWGEGLPIDATLTLDRFGFDVARDPDAPSVWARVSGAFRVSGPAADPGAIVVDGTISEGTVRAGTRSLRIRRPVPVRFEGGRLAFGPARFSGRGSELDVAAVLDAGTGEVEGGLRGHVDLGVLGAMIPDASAAGRMDVDLRISGSPEALRTEGTATLADGRMRFLGFPQAFEGIGFEVEFVGNEARILDVHAFLGGGEIRGRGGILLDGVALDSYRLELDGANVMVMYPEHFRAVYEGEVVLRGDAQAAELGGRLHMLRGEYTEPLDAGSLLGGGSREYSTAESLELPTRVYLDVDVSADGNVWMRNDFIEVESDFDLTVGGDLARPEVLGRIRVFEGGELRFRDVDYRVVSGTLDFVEIQRIDPYLDLRATTRVREYEIQLHIEGRLDRFDYELTSNPSLTQQDIIALLTTGSTLEELSARGGGRAFTGDLAAGYFAGALTDRFERQLQDALRLERLQISPLLVRGSGDPTARVTVGKEVADDVLLIYSSELGNPETQLYQIEWRASRKFHLTAGRDTFGGIGGEVLFSDHYWWRKPPSRNYGRSAGIERGRVEAEGFLGEVRLSGVPPGSEDEVRSRIPAHGGDPYRRSVLFEGAQNVREWYVGKNRLEARVDVVATPREDDPTVVDVTYRVDPGPRFEVAIEGASGRLQRRRIEARLRELWVEAVLTDQLFRDAVAEIESFFRERGRYTAEVRAVRETTGDPDVVGLRFEIDPGPEVRVADIRVEGNREISDDRIARQVLTRAGAGSRGTLVPRTLAEDVAAIRNLYRDQGFLDVRLDRPRIRLSVDGREGFVTVPIEEGPRLRVGSVSVEGPLDPFGPDEVTSWSGLAPEAVFGQGALLAAESAVRGALDIRGYPDARVEARATRDGDRMDVTLSVVSGGKRILADVAIEGNFTTKPRIITRELAMSIGDPISREAILRTQHALYGLGIFRNVRIDYAPVSADDPEGQRLRIRVEEAPPFGVTLGVGYDTEASFKGSFGVSHSNVGGRDRTLSLQGRISGIEERVQVLAEEPRLFGRKLPSLLSLLRERLEHPEFTEKRVATAFRVEKRFPERSSAVFARYNYQRVDLLDVQEDALETIRDQKLEDLILGDVSLSWLRSTRDDPFSPKRGSLSSAEVHWFAKPLLSEADFVKAFGQWTTVHTQRNGLSHAGAVRVGLSQPFGGTESVPLSERFFAGGDATLRGFPRDGVLPSGGESMLLLNYELRFPIWSAVRGAVFYDTGNVYPTLSDFDPTDLRHVLGAGFRIETPIGPLRFEYGHKLDRREGESAGEYFVAIGAPF